MGCASSTPVAPTGVVPGGSGGETDRFSKPSSVRTTPGARLLALASGSPALTQVALSIAAAAHVCGKSRPLAHDCNAFAVITASVEQCLCEVSAVKIPATSSLEDIVEALDDAVVYAKALQSPGALNSASSVVVKAPQLRASRDAIVAVVRSLLPGSASVFEQWSSVDFEDEAAAHEFIASKGGALAALEDSTARAQLSDILGIEYKSATTAAAVSGKRRADALLRAMQAETEEHQAVLVSNKHQQQVIFKRNELLKEQVSQMTTLLSAHNMRMKQFMERFPVPASEPERRLTIQKLKLSKLSALVPEVEACVDAYLSQPRVGASFGCILFNIVDEHVNRYFCGRSTDGPGSTTFINMPMVVTVPRKSSPCQYVAASGSVLCLDRAASSIMSADWLQPIMGDVVALSPDSSEAHSSLMSSKAMALASRVFSGELTVEQGIEQATTQGLNVPMVRWMFRTVGPDSLADKVAYHGQPLRVLGEDVGVCCSFLKLPEGADADTFDTKGLAASLRVDALVNKVGSLLTDYARAHLRA